jgi:hypothetical protein
MSLLLDTHVVLWWLADDPGLPEEIKDRLDHEPDVRVSAATIWEIAYPRRLLARPRSSRSNGMAGGSRRRSCGACPARISPAGKTPRASWAIPAFPRGLPTGDTRIRHPHGAGMADVLGPQQRLASGSDAARGGWRPLLWRRSSATAADRPAAVAPGQPGHPRHGHHRPGQDRPGHRSVRAAPSRRR